MLARFSSRSQMDTSFNTTKHDRIEKVLDSYNEPLFSVSGWLAVGIPLLWAFVILAESSVYIWRPIAIVLYFSLITFGLFLLNWPYGFFSLLVDIPLFLVTRVVLILFDALIAISILISDVRSASVLKEAIVHLEDSFDEMEKKSREEDEKLKLRYFSSDDFVLPLLGAFYSLVGIGQFCRHLYILAGGFIAEQAGFWHWLRFGLLNALEALLLDMPSVYEWNISEIRPAAFWSSTIIFVFRLTLEVIIIAKILDNLRLLMKWSRRRPITTIKNKKVHKSYFNFIFSKIGNLIKIALWMIPLFIGVIGIVHENLSLQTAWAFARLSMLFVASVWLIWYSAAGLLTISGTWNKIFAFLGFIGGISGFAFTIQYFVAGYR